MKILLLLLFFTIATHAQLFKYYKPERYWGDPSFAVVVDPYASYKEKGLNIGGEVELQTTAFGAGIYIRGSMSNFAALEDGYTDLVLGTGLNFSLDKFNQYRYYAGLRGGVIYRGGNPHAIGGVEAGIAWKPWQSGVYYGMRTTYDRRCDAEFYDGEKWEYSTYVLIGFKF